MDGWPSDHTVIMSRDKEIEQLRATVSDQQVETERLKSLLNTAYGKLGVIDGVVPIPVSTAEKMFLGLTDTQRLNALRKLCGFVENGSDTTVRIFQDDATRDWIVRCGEQRFYSNHLRGVLDEVFKYVDGLPE